jgi:4-hydroxy-tetrahydrodipicolinate synthase
VQFDGLVVPAITQFDENGQVDAKGVAEVTEVLISQGVHGIVACGTTGEAYSLTPDERHLVISTVIKQANGRVPVLSGVGGMSTNTALDQASLAKRMNCDGLMLAGPAYSVPTEDELAAHLLTVVNAVKMPTVLYDYPARVGVSISQNVLNQVADNEYIIGIKEASGDLTRIPMLQNNFAGRIDPVCGADVDSVIFMEAGVKSWIAGIANALPKAHLGIMNPQTRSEAHSAIKPLFEYIESGQYINKTKALMGILGLPSNYLRGPLKPLGSAQTDKLRELAAQAGQWAPNLV